MWGFAGAVEGGRKGRLVAFGHGGVVTLFDGRDRPRSFLTLFACKACVGRGVGGVSLESGALGPAVGARTR